MSYMTEPCQFCGAGEGHFSTCQYAPTRGSLFDELREAIGDLYGCSDVVFKFGAKIAFDEARDLVTKIELLLDGLIAAKAGRLAMPARAPDPGRRD